MKKTMILSTAMLILLGAAAVLDGQDAQAAKTKKVKATVKGSTLTISGKGAMSSRLKVKKSKQKKIKKIVVKKGVTSIPVDAFTKYKNVTSATVAASVKKIGQNAFRCRKLKKLTIPGDFTIVLYKKYEQIPLISDRVDTVIFNTKLKLARAAAFDANNLVVKKSDPNYKSIKGIIYTKDGKEIVRVPFQRSEVTLADGCETFCLQSVQYANKDEYDYDCGGCRVKKIVLPASVKKVESDRHYVLSDNGLDKRVVDGRITGLQVEVKSRQLDDRSLSQLVHVLKIDCDSLMKQMPDQISCSAGMYIVNTQYLLAYKGESKVIKIPEGVKKIGDDVFNGRRKIAELVLPEGLVEIGKSSFAGSFVRAYDGGTESVRRLKLPDSLEKIGDSAFENNGIEEIKFGKKIKEIGGWAFCLNNLKALTIPSTVTKIGTLAFDCPVIVIQGSSAGFSDRAFNDTCSLVYEKGPREQKVSIQPPFLQSYRKKKLVIQLEWSTVKSVDGYELVLASNSRFTKNKKKVTVTAEQDGIIQTMKGTFKKNMKVYARMRPYSYLNGEKIYGRWSQSVSDTIKEELEWLY